jgi:hypothetical protein
MQYSKLALYSHASGSHGEKTKGEGSSLIQHSDNGGVYVVSVECRH